MNPALLYQLLQAQQGPGFLPQYDPYNQPGMVGFGANVGQQGPEIFGAYGPEFGALALNMAGAQKAALMMNPTLLANIQRAQLNPVAARLAPAQDMAALCREQAAWNARQQQEIDALQAALAQLAGGRPVLGTDMHVLPRTGPVVPRELVVGVDSGATLIPAGLSVNIPLAPQVTFRLERFIAADTTSPNFDILDIRVGKDSQFVAAGAVPAEVFSSKAVGVGLKGDTAVPGIQIIITVLNKTLAAARFQGAIIGFATLNTLASRLA